MKKFSVERINFFLYSILLIITPFLMLQNYLQTAIGTLSRAELEIGNFAIPYTVLVAIILLILLVVFTFRYFTKKRFMAMAVVVALFFVGQNTADYYFGHKFYDLQHNWHYFAYGIFTYLAYRRFSLKKRPLYRIVQIILLSSLVISSFDEIVQIYISQRVFDISDIAKDMWGTLIGMVFIFFVMGEGRGFEQHRLRHRKIRDYFTHPFTMLYLGFIFIYCLLLVSSNLAAVEYAVPAVLFTIGIGLFIFLLIHLGNNRTARWIIRISGSAVLIFMIFSMFVPEQKVKYVSKGVVAYNNIPVIYFDCMIFPSGFIRPVDKKKVFVMRDLQKIDELNPEILLIGTGSKGQGGKGWNDLEISEMVYNTRRQNVYQVIKLKTPQACKEYNRLVKENKKVLFIIHNS